MIPSRAEAEILANCERIAENYALIRKARWRVLRNWRLEREARRLDADNGRLLAVLRQEALP